MSIQTSVPMLLCEQQTSTIIFYALCAIFKDFVWHFSSLATPKKECIHWEGALHFSSSFSRNKCIIKLRSYNWRRHVHLLHAVTCSLRVCMGFLIPPKKKAYGLAKIHCPNCCRCERVSEWVCPVMDCHPVQGVFLPCFHCSWDTTFPRIHTRRVMSRHQTNSTGCISASFANELPAGEIATTSTLWFPPHNPQRLLGYGARLLPSLFRYSPMSCNQ